MSQPLSGTSWAEIAEKGAIHVKSTGSYGPITAICSDLEDGEALAPLKWFVEGKEPWPTLTGRQQFYLDHPWYIDAGEALPVHKENPNGGGDYPIEVTGGHTRHSIHAIFRANKTLLNLQRGEPVLYMSERDSLDRDIHDHDLVRVSNDVGSYLVHVKPSPAVQPGQAIIYHAWEPYQFAGWNSSQNIVSAARSSRCICSAATGTWATAPSSGSPATRRARRRSRSRRSPPQVRTEERHEPDHDREPTGRAQAQRAIASPMAKRKRTSSPSC